MDSGTSLVSYQMHFENLTETSGLVAVQPSQRTTFCKPTEVHGQLGADGRLVEVGAIAIVRPTLSSVGSSNVANMRQLLTQIGSIPRSVRAVQKSEFLAIKKPQTV